MKCIKTPLLLLVTAIVGYVTCRYFLWIEVVYDGTITILSPVWMVGFPLVYLGTGWRLYCKAGKTSKAPRQSKRLQTFSVVLTCILVALNLMLRPYNLILILCALLLPLSLITIAVSKKYFGISWECSPTPMRMMTSLLLGTYVVALIATTAYLQILSPLTLETSQNLVNEQYGVGVYEHRYSGAINNDSYPVGAYVFTLASGEGGTIMISNLDSDD